MRITSKGQVTIPQHIRDEMGFLPGTEVEMIQKGEAVYLRKKKGGGARGHKLVAHMRNRASVKMSTDQIMALTRGR
jgi:AbrB family looped-hinge helix DNA binding protein